MCYNLIVMSYKEKDYLNNTKPDDFKPVDRDPLSTVVEDARKAVENLGLGDYINSNRVKIFGMLEKFEQDAQKLDLYRKNSPDEDFAHDIEVLGRTTASLGSTKENYDKTIESVKKDFSAESPDKVLGALVSIHLVTEGFKACSQDPVNGGLWTSMN